MELNSLTTGILGFLLGGALGYFFHDFIKNSLNMGENTARNFLIISITSIWVISMIVDVFSATYEVPIAVHTLLGGIVGFYFFKPKIQ